MSEATSVVTPLESFLAVVLSSRPFAWSFVPIVFAIGLINSRSRSGVTNKSTPWLMTAAQVFSLSFPLCIIVFGMNDVYDYNSDVRNPRKIRSGIEGGILFPVHHSTVQFAAYLSTALIFVTSLLTGKSQYVFVTTLVILTGWQYSAPPLRLKEMPLLDSFSNGLGFFLSWLNGYTFGSGKLSNMPRNQIFAFSLCVTGIHALAAAVDAEPDSAAGQTTIATFFGHRFAILFGTSMFMTASAMANDSNMLFNIYLWGGTFIMFVPCLRTTWAYYTFKTIIFWTLAIASLYFGSKVNKAMRPRSHRE